MLKREYASLSQRFENFEKITRPLKSKVINCASNALGALKVYVASDKSPKAKEVLRTSLDEWRNALDDYDANRLPE
jgi:hypothetical protein